MDKLHFLTHNEQKVYEQMNRLLKCMGTKK